MMTNRKAQTGIAGIFNAVFAATMVICCLAMVLSYQTAYALEMPEYTPGEDYRIDDEQAFQEQDVTHDDASDNEASTSYYLTSPFYLNWVSPDMTICEGSDAFIGCEATGLNDIRYEWSLSKDGGNTYESTGLSGNKHTISGLVVNDLADQPYLYRCLITNGDGMSTLEALVSITVLPASQAPSAVTDSFMKASSSLAQTGDSALASLICLCISALFASLALLIGAHACRKNDQQESA